MIHEIGGASAVFAGPGQPINKLAGLGFAADRRGRAGGRRARLRRAAGGAARRARDARRPAGRDSPDASRIRAGRLRERARALADGRRPRVGAGARAPRPTRPVAWSCRASSDRRQAALDRDRGRRIQPSRPVRRPAADRVVRPRSDRGGVHGLERRGGDGALSRAPRRRDRRRRIDSHLERARAAVRRVDAAGASPPRRPVGAPARAPARRRRARAATSRSSPPSRGRSRRKTCQRAGFALLYARAVLIRSSAKPKAQSPKPASLLSASSSE